VALTLTVAWAEWFLLLPARFALMVLTAGRGGNSLGRTAIAFRAVVRRMPTPSSKRLDEQEHGHQAGQCSLQGYRLAKKGIVTYLRMYRFRA
jgi:hypothetical protein